MLIDPLEEASKAGIGIRTEYPYQMSTGDPALLGPENSGSPPPGLVLGYSWLAGAGDVSGDSHMEGERGEYSPSLSASVWAFDSKAHAREYVERLAPNSLDQADQPVRAALPAAGNGAVLWRSGSGRHFRDLALMRRGNLVGEVVTAGFTTEGHGEAIEPLARALKHQMAQVEPRARPYDAAAVLAAPLPIEAWSALGEDRSSYPEVVSCRDSSSLCDVESIVWGASWGDAPEDRSALHLAPPDDEDFEDPADSDRNKQWAIDAARGWKPRLDVILG